MYIAVDIGNKAGISVCNRNADNTVELVACGEARKVGTKGRYKCLDYTGESMLDAWVHLFDTYKPSHMVVERGFGNRPNVISAQSEMRGYLRALCEINNAEYRQVNVSEWRRAVKDAFNVTFPNNTDAAKSLSLRLAKEQFGLDGITDNMSDSVMIAVACARLGYV
jgi:hypothetical protein